MGTYIVTADVQARMSAQVVKRIFDDDADGTADTTSLTRLIADAESYVEGFLRRVYDLTAIRALGTAAPNEVKRLCLDVATAYAVDRWPTYVRADGHKLLERARRDLMDLAEGRTRLDIVASPEPAANVGGEARSGDPDDTDLRDKVFVDDMGDW